MRYVVIVISSFLPAFQSCQTSLTDYATQWSNSMKQKITEDANQQADKIFYDSTYHYVSLYKGDKKLKSFQLIPRLSTDSKTIYFDTAVSTFYSADQNFELVRELCPAIDRSFEGIKYKGRHIGLAELKYCNGQIKERGYRFNGDVGVWKEYDLNGKVIQEEHYGNVDRLEGLKKISYYR